MKKWIVCSGLLAWSLFATAQRSIAIIGGSTAYGKGATAGHGWAYLTEDWLKSKGLIDTIYNTSVIGYTTWDVMPTGSSYPAGANAPDTMRNVTRALSHRPLPKVVIIALPINDLINGYTIRQYLGNLRLLYDTVVAQGSICFITSSQPANYSSLTLRKSFREAADSILMEYPNNSFDFYDTLVNNSLLSDSLKLKTEYNSGDGIHPDDAGHLALFEQVQASQPFMAALLLQIGQPAVVSHALSTAKIQWKAAHVDTTVTFTIQRSSDGVQFTDIGKTPGMNNVVSRDFTFTDLSAPEGTSYYRIHATGQGQDAYSALVGYVNPGKLGLGDPAINAHSNSTVQIGWQADHVDTSITFYIQRGPDTLQYTDIGLVKGVISTAAQNFSFTDKSAPEGTSYYRIHATGNGQDIYSSWISYSYTNPAQGQKKLNLDTPVITTSSLSTVQLGWHAYNADTTVTCYIQRGSDTLQYDNIGQVAATSSDSTQTFSFTDSSAPEGTSYYRIRATGEDQDIYSSWISYSYSNPNSGQQKLSLGTPVITAASFSTVQIGWQAAHIDSTIQFFIERGTDSLQLTNIGVISGTVTDSTQRFSFTDTAAPTGTSYYRIHATGDQDVLSYAVGYANPGKDFGLVKLYSAAGSSEVVTEVVSQKNQTMILSVYSMSGTQVYSRQISVTAPTMRLSLNIPGLSAGIYFVKLSAGGGQKDSRAFVKF